jgi:hypothetical protein
MRKLLLVVCLVAGISSCASSGRIGEIPTVPLGQPAGKLVVIRVSSIVGVANSYYIAIDGKDIFAIRSGEHTEFTVGAGEHYIAVKCFGGWSPTWKEDSIKFSASSEKESFFKISPNMTCAQIKPIEADEAKKLIATSKFISPETLSGSK